MVTILFLYIASMFPNAMTDHLLLNMKQLGYPMEAIEFYAVMLCRCHTVLTFDIPIDNGIGQGESSSMLLYLIYSHTLVAIPSSLGGDGGALVLPRLD